MLQVANKTCQYKRKDGKVITVEKGEVVDLPKLHIHCRRVGTESDKVNFAKASESELLASKWKVSDARKFLEDLNVELRKGSKEKMVAQILDARYRAVDLPEDGVMVP